MSKRPLGEDINLHIEEISVDYKRATELIPELWKKYKPRVRLQEMKLWQQHVISHCILLNNLIFVRFAKTKGKPKLNTICSSLQLIVHVGVSGIASKITLEQQAHNDGYDKFDVKGSCPDNHCCVMGAEDCAVSGIDMQLVCQHINEAPSDISAEVSLDAGRCVTVILSTLYFGLLLLLFG